MGERPQPVWHFQTPRHWWQRLGGGPLMLRITRLSDEGAAAWRAAQEATDG